MAQKGGGYNRGGKRQSPYWRDRPSRPGNKPKQDRQDDDARDRDRERDSDRDRDRSMSEEAGLSDNSVILSEGKREKKYSNRGRLFVGNLPKSVSEEQLMDLFKPYTSDDIPMAHIEKEKNFGFVRMPYRLDAEKAIAALNGSIYQGRELRVRVAASSCSVKVSNLHPMVSNELLADAFSQFGEVENAIVVTDERGKSMEYGIVDFAKKSHAIQALQVCSQRFFLLTRSPMPVVVSELTRENEEGLPDKLLQKNSSYSMEREFGPRFATPGTAEFDMAARWCAVYDNEKLRQNELDVQLKDARSQLMQEMDQFNRHDFMQEHTMQLRAQLAHHREEQARLADEIRRQEDQMHGMMAGGSGYSPQPLFSGQSRADHVKTILPNPPGLSPAVTPGSGGGLMPHPYLSPMAPPSMMGPRYPQ